MAELGSPVTSLCLLTSNYQLACPRRAQARNMLTGTLPHTRALPASLSQLSLDNNRLSGTINPDWVLPANLTWLDIVGVVLEGKAHHKG